MKTKFKLTILFVLFKTITFAQDCNCNLWKKTSFDSNGKPSYTYVHACNVNSSDFEFVGFDVAYCKSQEETRAKLSKVKSLISEKLNEEIQESDKNSRTKLTNKDGYEITNWYYPSFTPTIGIKNTNNDNYILWDENGDIIISGSLKDGLLDGVFQWYGKGKSVYNYYVNSTFVDPPRPSKNIFDENLLKIYSSIYGYDRLSNKYKLIETHNIDEKYVDFLIENGKLLMAFTNNNSNENKLIRSEAYSIYEKIINTEFEKAKQERIRQYSTIKKSMEEYILRDSLNLSRKTDKIKSIPLSKKEKYLLGDWSLTSELVKSDSYNIYYTFNEKISFYQDRAYKTELVANEYKLNEFNQLELSKENKPYIETGIWEVRNDSLFLFGTDKEHTIQEDYEKYLYSFVCRRIDNIDQEFLKDDFLKFVKFNDSYFFGNHEYLKYVDWKEELRYNYNLHVNYLNKIRFLNSKEQYLYYARHREKMVLCESKLIKLSEKKLTESISISQLERSDRGSKNIIMKGIKSTSK